MEKDISINHPTYIAPNASARFLRERERERKTVSEIWGLPIVKAGTELHGKSLVASRASKFKKLLALTNIQWPSNMHRNSLVDVKAIAVK